MDGFEDVDLFGRYKARPSVTVTVYKTADQDAIDIVQKIGAFLAGKTGRPFEQSWADGFTPRGRAANRVYQTAAMHPYTDLPGRLETHSNLARFIEGRLDLVKRNGAFGLMLLLPLSRIVNTP